MTGREIVKRVLAYDHPPRMAYDFIPEEYHDILHVGGARLLHPDPSMSQFAEYPELLARVPHFRGEVRLDNYGNIYGRLQGKTKGECVLGVLQHDFAAVEAYQMPGLDDSFYAEMKQRNLAGQDKYVLAGMPVAIFSTLRDMRLMDNALADTVLDPDHIAVLMDKITAIHTEIVDRAAGLGIDGMMIGDDWGMQNRLFIRPESFRELFLPTYKKLGDMLHAKGMHFFMHSCGYVYDIIDDLIGAGVDAFQFDQPELSGSCVLAEKLAGKAALYSPVDIQKIMASGNRQVIEDAAETMANAFRKLGGGLIMKDYPAWQDIDIPLEWADWARAMLIKNSWI